MNIGIFLAYGPRTNLRTEGLGRYVASLIKGFQDSNNQVIIACPKWTIDSLEDLFEDYMIDSDNIKFIISYKRPILWNIYEMKFLKKKKEKKIKLLYTIGEYFENLMELLISITNVFLFSIIAISLFFIALLLSPLIILATFGFIIYKIIYELKNKSKKKVKSIKEDFFDFFNKFSKTGLTIYDFFLENLNKNVENELVKKINNKENKCVDVWYSPSAFWKGFNDIEGVRVLNVPDLVTSEFPSIFAHNKNFIDANNKVLNNIKNGKYFVTYCEFVKNELLIKKLSKNPLKTCSIYHASNQMSEHIEFIDSVKVDNIDYESNFARSILETLPRNCDYLNKFNFKDIKYIFYASQSRPHKNILTLIKAYEYLLRDKYYNFKLFLTCNLDSDPEISSYLKKRRLQYDVLSFTNVSSQQLAALYKCAELSVNPTLYEGGFPFTFSEGMSVGTPSIMSDIPQTREIFDRYRLDEFLFNPYDYKDLAKKIEMFIWKKDLAYERQHKLFEELKYRTPSVVANEYVEAFEWFVEVEKKEGDYAK